MRKEIFMVALTVAVVTSGCGAKSEAAAPETTTVAEATVAEPSEESRSNLEAVGDVKVDKGIFDVKLEIPADFVGNSTQEDLDN